MRKFLLSCLLALGLCFAPPVKAGSFNVAAMQFDVGANGQDSGIPEWMLFDGSFNLTDWGYYVWDPIPDNHTFQSDYVPFRFSVGSGQAKIAVDIAEGWEPIGDGYVLSGNASTFHHLTEISVAVHATGSYREATADVYCIMYKLDGTSTMTPVIHPTASVGSPMEYPTLQDEETLGWVTFSSSVVAVEIVGTAYLNVYSPTDEYVYPSPGSLTCTIVVKGSNDTRPQYRPPGP